MFLLVSACLLQPVLGFCMQSTHTQYLLFSRKLTHSWAPSIPPIPSHTLLLLLSTATVTPQHLHTVRPRISYQSHSPITAPDCQCHLQHGLVIYQSLYTITKILPLRKHTSTPQPPSAGLLTTPRLIYSRNEEIQGPVPSLYTRSAWA